jgi:glycerol-3-phosphate dehydrogenase (NAD(P)+)
MREPCTVATLGAGSWGTALAIALAREGHRTRLWGRDARQVAEMTRAGVNARYLPGRPFPSGLTPTSSLGAALDGADLVLLAVPSHAMGATLERVAGAGCPSRLVWATKGFDPASGRLLHEVAREHLGEGCVLAVLSGPTFAREVAAGAPTAVSLAAFDPIAAARIARVFHAPRFRVYTTTDVVGVEVGGAVKNVLAVAAGISDGLGFGANARAALITRGLAELTRLGEALGARRETLMGLAGLGDLVLTCTDDQSRNRRFGLAVGAGTGLDEAERAVGQVVEGRSAAGITAAHAQRLGVDMPITAEVVRVLVGEVTPAEAVRALLAREQRPEDD